MWRDWARGSMRGGAGEELVFNKSLLLNTQEQRGAYWIKKYEDVFKAFE